MSLWEYKVITSGKGGFASPALLEKFLNDLGRDEWEIVQFEPQAGNLLAFTGLARRSTQRDWSLQDAAAAAAKAEAEKLRAEFAAKFQAASGTAATEEKPASFLEEKMAPDDGFRKPVDTSRDSEPDAPEEEAEKDEWDNLAQEDELPTFFDALKPHMRRNQRGPGMSVGVDYLAKKWSLSEEDVKGALVECGMQIPGDENAKPVYVEYDGDLYWVNINRRGELWINVREKPRPVFRVVQGTRVANDAQPEAEAQPASPEPHAPRPERAEGAATGGAAERPAHRNAKPESAPAGILPAGPALLERVRPLMRRNRRGPGGSGSASFLSRALKVSESELTAGFKTLGLVVPEKPDDKPVMVEIGPDVWWLNHDSRGGLWINGREKEAGEALAAPDGTPSGQALGDSGPLATAPSGAPEAGGVLSAVRLLLKETKTGSVAGKADRLAEELGRSPDEFVATLLTAGLKVPEKPREKPVFVEHAGEIFWLNKNAKDELWLNAKVSKFADKTGDDGGRKRPSRGGRKKADGVS
ncbi:MAG: hypothetical protein JWM88_577 [Verrucomicrobia bacterium]|nr:hypothetical protein [Verrucomicrobiota bacterium]